jgi:epoxyqueuosine reductase QueG
VCPWNVRFAQALGEPAYAPRPALAGKDARTLARELLGMTQAEFSAGFKGSPMKRAKLRGLKRDAAVVLANVGSSEDDRRAGVPGRGRTPRRRSGARGLIPESGVIGGIRRCPSELS